MAEYIDKEALLAEYDRVHVVPPGGARKLIEEAPAVDVVYAVRSEWKYFRKQGKAVCMNCSFERGVDDNFGRAVACPNCGARMEEGE